jgi:hypothetical protein
MVKYIYLIFSEILSWNALYVNERTEIDLYIAFFCKVEIWGLISLRFRLTDE